MSAPINADEDVTMSPLEALHVSAQQAFVREGTFVAFPLCFPRASDAIVHDESRITALDRTDDGVVYGATGGHAVHLFVGLFRGVTGAVVDLGVIEGAASCVAVTCGPSQVLAFVNGPEGGAIVAATLEPTPYDLIQEWGFERRPLIQVHAAPDRFAHAVALAGRRQAVASTAGGLLLVDLKTGATELGPDVRAVGRMVPAADGSVYGVEAGGTLWRYSPSADAIERRSGELPPGTWQGAHRWAADPVNGTLYLFDDEGGLHAIAADGAVRTHIAQAMATPVMAAAVTFDGRLFGVCGRPLSRYFTYEPGRDEIRDLGVMASTIERRRYGWEMSSAIVGREGEIVFGEEDDGGHLWLYFPRVQAPQPDLGG
jgi:hypothetical protein